MAEPKLIEKRQLINQSVSLSGSPKSPSQKSVKQFSSQHNIVTKTLNNSSRDTLANTLSKKSASNDGNYPKCSSMSGNPCIDTGGYIPKRAYPGSGMAGWKEAGLAGNTNKQISVGAGVAADVFIFGVGVSGDIGGRNHNGLLCTDLTACIQIGLGLHAGLGVSANGGIEKIQTSNVSLSVGGFGNFFAAGGSINTSAGSVSGGKGLLGAGVGASGGAQLCGTISVSCFK